MVAKSQLKCFAFFILILEITPASLKQGIENTEEVKPQINKPETEPDNVIIDDIDEEVDTEEEIDEGAEKSYFYYQMKNIIRYEALLFPAITNGVPLVETEKQERAKQGQRSEGTTAVLKIGSIFQDKLQKILSKKENDEGS